MTAAVLHSAIDFNHLAELRGCYILWLLIKGAADSEDLNASKATHATKPRSNPKEASNFQLQLEKHLLGKDWSQANLKSRLFYSHRTTPSTSSIIIFPTTFQPRFLPHILLLPLRR